MAGFEQLIRMQLLQGNRSARLYYQMMVMMSVGVNIIDRMKFGGKNCHLTHNIDFDGRLTKLSG